MTDLVSLRDRIVIAAKDGSPLVWSRVTWFDPNPKHYPEPILEAQAHDGADVLADIYHQPLRAKSKRYEIRVFGRSGCFKFNCAAPERAFATMEREASREWKRRQIFNRPTGA
ncbi:hypothetical protein B6S44_24975 [Bosea sp. Tri-44]|uniref:hypothetical protein n=1 Tax=Bosea sp. Tri-44 TaxID=1972137 RepID=UPI00100E152A|nr:hypothetical protein [Bosea sp. Tri-44]RXT46098.1 hypothetical protein B6S44_24975 [Bosea sp. Tri-44]